MIEFSSREAYLKYLFNKQEFGYKFAIYGAGKNSYNVIDDIKNYIEVSYIIDKDIKKCGKYIEKIEVMNIYDFDNINDNVILIYGIQSFEYVEYVKKLFKNKIEIIRPFLINMSVPQKLKSMVRANDTLKQHLLKIQCIEDDFPKQSEVAYTYKNGKVYKLDTESEGLNIVNGDRVVKIDKNIKVESLPKLKIYGDSRFFLGVSDEYTLPSLLQTLVYEHYKVENKATGASDFWDVKSLIMDEDFCLGDVVILNSSIGRMPNYDFYNDLTEKEIAYVYMKPVIEIKLYLDSIGIKMVFIWTPNIKEIDSYGMYEKEIIKAMDSIDSIEHPNLGKVANYKSEFVLMIPDIDQVMQISNYYGITICNLIDKLNKKDFDAYIDAVHFTTIGLKYIAKIISEMVLFERTDGKVYELIDNMKRFSEQQKFNEYFNKGELADYLKTLEENIVNSNDVGSIVMNANPFTLGHKYLVNQASKQVDTLYIFVVEEDKSFFKFNDRIELVKRGVSDLNNVIVVPSGRAIISSLTMPEYFDKETNTEQTLDASVDIAMFGNLIAPKCGIKKRFVGSEPNCKITAQYNKQLGEKLVEYGIELIIIERISTEDKICDDIISATKVRKYLDEKDVDAIKRYVPKTTLDFLVENYI